MVEQGLLAAAAGGHLIDASVSTAKQNAKHPA
jgi:hypothetical protein